GAEGPKLPDLSIAEPAHVDAEQATMAVLVTGGSGFIGSHVIDRLLAAGHRPRIYDLRPSPYHVDVDAVLGDLEDVDRLQSAMRGCSAVIHLAAAADVDEVVRDPLEA